MLQEPAANKEWMLALEDVFSVITQATSTLWYVIFLLKLVIMRLNSLKVEVYNQR